MKKITYIISGGLLIAATACNKPTEFDQATCDMRADSIVDARCAVDAPAVEEEYSEMCTRQLAVLTATRDSLSNIFGTASNVKYKKKTAAVKKEEGKVGDRGAGDKPKVGDRGETPKPKVTER